MCIQKGEVTNLNSTASRYIQIILLLLLVEIGLIGVISTNASLDLILTPILASLVLGSILMLIAYRQPH